MQAAKDGVAMLALRSDAQILPVGVVDTDRFWPKGKLPRLGGHVEMRVGEPFRLSEALPPGPRPAGRQGRRDRADHGAGSRRSCRARQQGVYGAAPALPAAAALPDPGVSAPRVR